jgi:hypothetical protein
MWKSGTAGAHLKPTIKLNALLPMPRAGVMEVTPQSKAIDRLIINSLIQTIKPC